jgi:hypothetical protein
VANRNTSVERDLFLATHTFCDAQQRQQRTTVAGNFGSAATTKGPAANVISHALVGNAIDTHIFTLQFKTTIQ